MTITGRFRAEVRRAELDCRTGLRVIALEVGYSPVADLVSQLDPAKRVFNRPITGVSVLSTGVVKASDLLVSPTEFTAGRVIVALAIYKERASEATSTIVGFITNDNSGVPISVLTGTEDLLIRWNPQGLIR